MGLYVRDKDLPRDSLEDGVAIPSLDNLAAQDDGHVVHPHTGANVGECHHTSLYEHAILVLAREYRLVHYQNTRGTCLHLDEHGP